MGTIECNDEANSFKYKLVLETTVESLRVAIESKTGTSVAENCYAFIEAVEGISTGGDCTDCENNLQSCIDAKALLETEITDLNSQIATLTNDLNTCTTDKTEIQSNLDDCIAEKGVIQDALDTANDSIETLENRIAVINSRLDTIIGHEVVGDEIDKLDEVDANKLAVKVSIESKTGSELTEDFSTYSTAIDSIHLDSYIIEAWEEQAGRDKFVGIINLYPETHNTIRVKIDTKDGNDISIDWGDGVVENVASGVFEHTYNYETLDSKLFQNDKKQAIVTIATSAESDRFSDIEILANLVDGRVNSSFCKVKLESDNQLNLASAFAYGTLQEFEYIGNCNATNLGGMFKYASRLKIVIFKNTPHVNMSDMFFVSSLDLLVVKDGVINPSACAYMFRSVSSYGLARISTSGIDCSGVTSAYYMFGGSKGIATITLLNSNEITNWNYFALGCNSVSSLSINMFSATSATRAFENLYNLKTINLTLLPVSTDITNCKVLPISEIENLILNQLKDVSADTTQTLRLTGTVTEDELTQDALDHAVAYGWDLVF